MFSDNFLYFFDTSFEEIDREVLFAYIMQRVLASVS